MPLRTFVVYGGGQNINTMRSLEKVDSNLWVILKGSGLQWRKESEVDKEN